MVWGTAATATGPLAGGQDPPGVSLVLSGSWAPGPGPGPTRLLIPHTTC